MSYLRTITDLIQTLSVNDAEIENLLKEIDEINTDNTKYETQLDEFEREHVRLQIEYHNLETISSFNDVTAIENLKYSSQKMYKDCVELKALINKIDFTKILQCNHMEMEARCRKEWQPIEDCFITTLNWHQQMEQRHVVQRYRQAEIAYCEAENSNKIQLKSMEESLKQSIELINKGKDRRNNILVALIKGRENLDDFNKKMIALNQYEVYIEGLRQEKLNIQNQLEQTHCKAFKPKFNLSGNPNTALAVKSNEVTSNFIMPKFPSFSDILQSFNQAEKETNNSSFCVKSILHTSSKTSITTKQTKNVHFKVQLEEYQEEITEIETETDVDEMSVETTIEPNQLQDNADNLQEMKDLHNNSKIETIDLLTPAANTEKVLEETTPANDYLNHDLNGEQQIASKSTIDIQDCVIFKTPFPIEDLKYIRDSELDKENISDNVTNNHSKTSTDLCSSNTPQQNIREILNTTKNYFYEEFLKELSSAEASPKQIEGFENFLNENQDTVLFPKDSNEPVSAASNSSAKNYASDIQDFLDFGCNRRFTFDSDDNIGNTNNSENMDFM